MREPNSPKNNGLGHKIQNPGLFIILALSAFTLLALAAYNLSVH